MKFAAKPGSTAIRNAASLRKALGKTGAEMRILDNGELLARPHEEQGVALFFRFDPLTAEVEVRGGSGSSRHASWTDAVEYAAHQWGVPTPDIVAQERGRAATRKALEKADLMRFRALIRAMRIRETKRRLDCMRDGASFRQTPQGALVMLSRKGTPLRVLPPGRVKNLRKRHEQSGLTPQGIFRADLLETLDRIRDGFQEGPDRLPDAAQNPASQPMP